MENENFYIHLSSNVIPTSPTQISNKIGNFVTRLNRRLNLSEDWEVALTDISYTKSWYNIMKNEKITLRDDFNREIELEDELPAGNYVNVEELVEKINNIINDYFEEDRLKNRYPPKLIYNKQSNKIKMRLGYNGGLFVYPRFSDYLAQFLGLADSRNQQYPFNSYTTQYENIARTQNTRDSNEQQNDQSMLESVFPDTENSSKIPNENQTIGKIISTSIERPASLLNDSTSDSGTNENKNESNSENKILEQRTKRRLSGVGAVLTELSTKLPIQVLPQSISTTVGPKVGNSSNSPEETTTIQPNLNKSSNSSKADGALPSQEFSYVYAFNEVSVHGSVHSLYVYCNIIKPIFVGNTEAPLIRRVYVPYDKKFGDNCEINYFHPQYYPLVWHEFDSIEIDIKDDSDRTIDFAYGRTAVTLHLRKKAKNVVESLYQLLR